jgi:hypothetical protein
MYLNVFIIYLWCISMCLNVFIDIVIGILPSYSHCNVLTMYTQLHFFFTLHNDSLPSMLYHYIIIFPFPLIHSNFHTIYEKITYQSLLHIYTSPHIPHSTIHIPHSTFQVPHSMLSHTSPHIPSSTFHAVEHSGAQVAMSIFSNQGIFYIPK